MFILLSKRYFDFQKKDKKPQIIMAFYLLKQFLLLFTPTDLISFKKEVTFTPNFPPYGWC